MDDFKKERTRRQYSVFNYDRLDANTKKDNKMFRRIVRRNQKKSLEKGEILMKKQCRCCYEEYEFSFIENEDCWEDSFCSESCYESYFDYFEDDIGFDVLFPEEF